MYFPIDVNVRGTEFKPGQINEVPETPGSIRRWESRGCTIEKKEPILDKEDKRKELEKEAEAKAKLEEEAKVEADAKAKLEEEAKAKLEKEAEAKVKLEKEAEAAEKKKGKNKKNK